MAMDEAIGQGREAIGKETRKRRARRRREARAPKDRPVLRESEG